MAHPIISLSSPITDIPGIGPAKAALLAKLGITHARDFLFTFPRDYEDFSHITPVKALTLGEKCTVRGKITQVKSSWGFQGRRRLLRIYVDITDETGTLHVTWYNLRFLEKQLHKGRELFVAGVVEQDKAGRWTMRSPALEFADKNSDRLHTGSITPIYPETRGVTSRFLRYQAKRLLPLIQAVPEYMPAEIIERNDLVGIHDALRAIHFPKNNEEQKAADARLRFDELFFLQLAALVRRQAQQKSDAPAIVPIHSLDAMAAALPFDLTGAQQKALKDVLRDIKKPHPMNRLVQGDVGSGKSAVALLAARAVLDAGYKVLYLAPTEILARQQHESFAKSLPEHSVHLLVGALPEQEKKLVKKYLQDKEACCVVGTHALLQEDVATHNVGLVIIDEQHRFGVAQRSHLQKRKSSGFVPHLLSMTATPIPRTLNLTVYGDLDVSVLDEMPPGRKPITTRVVLPPERDEAITHLLEELHKGRQAYVITPLVEDSEKLQQKSAKQAYGEMQKWLPGIAVGLVHGKMPAQEKEAVMKHFAAGAIQVLVSTSVVEVGVNVPNATMMIIEGAERFGLAQLHQFRGRIGRGEHASTCYLFPTTNEAAQSKRLHIIANTIDGFAIAEADLELRGPGEVYGMAQSGYGNLKVASLLDYPLIQRARAEAEAMLQQDPALQKHIVLQKKVAQKNTETHFE